VVFKFAHTRGVALLSRVVGVRPAVIFALLTLARVFAPIFGWLPGGTAYLWLRIPGVVGVFFTA